MKKARWSGAEMCEVNSDLWGKSAYLKSQNFGSTERPFQSSEEIRNADIHFFLDDVLDFNSSDASVGGFCRVPYR